MNEKIYRREQFRVGVANTVQSKVPRDLFINGHEPLAKCQVQIEKSLISSPLITSMKIIAFYCLFFSFLIIFFNLPQCDIPPCKQGKPCAVSDLTL